MLRRLVPLVKTLAWLVPGLLLWASFPPVGEMLDVYAALAPLMWFARRNAPRKSAGLFFRNGLVFWIGTLSWMTALTRNGGPWPLVVLGWLFLSLYCSAYFAAFGWLDAHVWAWAAKEGKRTYAKRLFAIIVAEPVLWAGLELVRSRLFGGFAWNLLGVAPANAGFGAPASLGGVYLLSATVVLVNGTIASIADRMMARKDAAAGMAAAKVPQWLRSVETLAPFAIVFGIYAACGGLAGRTDVKSAAGPRGSMTVALFQRNFPCVFSGTRENPVVEYSKLADSVAPFNPDLAVLPESACSEVGLLGGPEADMFTRFLSERSGARAVIAGGAREEDGKMFNSAMLARPGPGPRQIYDKVHLVPFGEYIPLDDVFPALKELAPVGSCTPGVPKLFDFEGAKIAPAICYEDTDSALIRRQAAAGADLLVFITNDNWYSGSCETEQHFWQAVARCAETGLAAVRCGNSGVSAAIYPWGWADRLSDADGRTIVDARGAMVQRVPLGAAGGRPTLYVRLGDTPLAIAFLLLIAALCVVKYLESHEQRRQMPL